MTRTKIGRYEIRRELGRGGMATVYLAYDPRFKREVAIKVLPPQFTHDPTFRQRFDNEAQTIAQIEHYAIVPVYDHGEDEGWPYIVMRLMNGGSLADKLKEGALPLNEVNDILQRIASALHKAHQRGVVHRDVKPDNILFDEEGLAYLSDFGIAQLAEGTRTVTILGTPEYMTPEQVNGAALSPQTDVYQLGIVLFEMLTGQVPFSAPSPVALLHQHVYNPVPSVRQVNSELPGRCEMVITRALAKEKEDRYATVLELARDFERVLKAGAYQLPQPRPLEPTPTEPIHPPPLKEIPLVSQDRIPQQWRVGYWLGGAMALLGLVALFSVGFLYLPEMWAAAFGGTTPATNVVAKTPTPSGADLTATALSLGQTSPLATPTAKRTATPSVTPTHTPAPNTARIIQITLNHDVYEVAFETYGFEPLLPGQHVHFFFNTVSPENAGNPGTGPWQLYPTTAGGVNTSPFTLLGINDKPAEATKMCILVANHDHSVNLDTGNCVPLP